MHNIETELAIESHSDLCKVCLVCVGRRGNAGQQPLYTSIRTKHRYVCVRVVCQTGTQPLRLLGGWQFQAIKSL